MPFIPRKKLGRLQYPSLLTEFGGMWPKSLGHSPSLRGLQWRDVGILPYGSRLVVGGGTTMKSRNFVYILVNKKILY